MPSPRSSAWILFIITRLSPGAAHSEEWLRRLKRKKMISPALFPVLEDMRWERLPLGVNVTLGTTENLFFKRFEEETEHHVHVRARQLGLEFCPNWIVPAFCAYVDEHPEILEGKIRIIFCLKSDYPASRACGFMLEKRNRKWALRERELDTLIIQKSSTHWVLIKPDEPRPMSAEPKDALQD